MLINHRTGINSIMKSKYKAVWLVFVQIEPKENFSFVELVDFEGQNNSDNYSGAWANVIIRANTIEEVIELVPKGLDEKHFKVLFIDKIENVQSLIEYNELDKKVIQEIDWLLSTEYVFMISDKIFPYQ